jgi:tetratricopeptide (TPR) repeat protein
VCLDINDKTYRTTASPSTACGQARRRADGKSPPPRADRAPALTGSRDGSYLLPLTKVPCQSRPQEQLMPDAHRDDIAKLEGLYAEHPEGRIFTHLAEAYRKAGELDRAVEVLHSGLERHPEYSSAHVVLGRVLHDQGKTDDAELAFRRVLDLDRHNLVALRALGDLARADGRNEEALNYYQRLLDVEPADEDVRNVMDEMTSQSFADADLTWTEPSDEAFDAAFDAALDSVDQAEPSGEAGPAFQEPVWLSPETAPHPPEPEPQPTEPEPVPVPGEPETAEPEPEPAEPDQAAEAAGAEPDQATDPWASPVGDAEATSEAPPEPWATPAAEETEEPARAYEDGNASRSFDWTDAHEPPPSEEGEASDEAAEEPAPTLSPGVMTETIAQVYARQGLYDRAAEVYRELVRARPGDQALWDKLHEMEELASSAEPGAPDEAAADEAVSTPPGLETTQFRPGQVDVERLPGLESDDIDGGTGLSVDDLAAAAREPGPVLDRESALPAREEEPEADDDDAAGDDAPWAAAPPEGFEAPEPFGATGEPEADRAVAEQPDAEQVDAEPADAEPAAADQAAADQAAADQAAAHQAAADQADADQPVAGEEEEAGAVWLPGALAAGEPDEPTPYAWAEAGEPADADASAPIHSYLRSLLSWAPGRAGEEGTETSPDTAEEPPAEPSTEPGSEGSEDVDEDDDLDTFRSWLESLKQ